MKAFPSQAQPKEEHSLNCRMPNCQNLWSVDINHGRVCSMHDRILSATGRPTAREKSRQQAAIPFSQAARPFAEPAEFDDAEAF